MKHKLTTIIIAFALSSCATPSATPPPTSLLPSATFTQLPTRSPTPELTATPSFTTTPLPSATPIPIQSPTAANTEIAPETVGKCPIENPELKPGFDITLLATEVYPNLADPVLDFLNKGGTTKELEKAFSQYWRGLYEGDLTGDGIVELGIFDSTLNILGCLDGKYVVLLVTPDSPMFHAPEIFSVRDMNLNGIPDIVVYNSDSCGFLGHCSDVVIYEWHKNAFQLLTKNATWNEFGSLSMRGPFDVGVKDIDNNGTLELFLEGGIIATRGDYYEGLPWRVQTDTYMWDGEAYSFYRTEFSAPEYRFQAVQDGDEAMRWNEFDKALAFYQQTIFDENLKPWPAEQPAYELEKWMAGFAPETPTPAPTPTADPAEYPSLAAYARYRIMLLHLQQGHESDAKVVYDTLQQKFPQGQAGHSYAELAVAFWATYQEQHNLEKACSVAIKYAASHKQDILSYIGDIEGDYQNAYHGWQSHDYTPEDICPLP